MTAEYSQFRTVQKSAKRRQVRGSFKHSEGSNIIDAISKEDLEVISTITLQFQPFSKL